MLNNNENIADQIINEFSKTIAMFGLTPLEARLFAFLYLSDEPMTLDEMSEAIGKSKTSMSTSMRNLSELNLVTRVWKKGVRKDLYQANSQLFKAFMHSYCTKWIDVVSQQKNGLKDMSLELVEQREENRDRLSLQLQDIINFHTQLEKVFKKMKPD